MMRPTEVRFECVALVYVSVPDEEPDWYTIGAVRAGLTRESSAWEIAEIIDWTPAQLPEATATPFNPPEAA